MAAGSAGALESPALVPSFRLAPGEVRWTGDDALGRWSLVAGAQRAAWDPIESDTSVPLPVSPRDARHALLAESASGRVAFDAQRAFLGQRLDARFFATRAALSLREDDSARVASLDERSSTRLQRTRFGFSAMLAGRGRTLGLPWDHTLAVRVGGESLDSRNTLA